MSNVPDDIIAGANELLKGIMTRLEKCNALGQRVEVAVTRQGGPTRTFDNAAKITFVLTKVP